VGARLTPYAPAITTRSYYNAFGCSSPERNPIKSKILLAAPLLVDCFIVSGIVVASLDVSYGQIRNNISPSSATSQGNNALRSLALALSSGKEAMHPFRGSRSENDPANNKLNPPIAGMDCYLDRVAIHVSCHSSLVYTEEEAATLFTWLMDELQAALPSDRWIGTSKEFGTGMASIRSYTYEDQRTNAHIDILLTAQI
jgi:hypothetical protein